jgi:hypothetical protein
MMSEISNDIGDMILPEALDFTLSNENTPQLWELSCSKLTWPTQKAPGKKARNIWKKFLKTFLNEHKKLIRPLGTWLSTDTSQRKWHYTTNGSQLLETKNEVDIIYKKQIDRCNTIVYTKDSPTGKTADHPTIPVTPTSIEPGAIKCRQTVSVRTKTKEANAGTYKIFDLEAPYCPGLPLEAKYSYTISNNTLQVEGIIRQHQIPLEVIQLKRWYRTRPTHKSANAWGCLLIASHFHHYHNNDPTAQTTINITNSTARKDLERDGQTNPTLNTCYTSKWEVYHQAMKLLHQSNTTIKVLTQDDELLLEDWITDTQYEQYINNTKPYRERLHKIESVFLTIRHKQVTTEYSQTIRHEVSAHAATKYLQSKFHWTDEEVQDIQWQAHRQAISLFAGLKHKSIIQLLHKWLPVNVSHSKGSFGTASLCPFCMSCEETQEHFLSCQHDHLKQAWLAASTAVVRKRKTHDKELNHHVLRLIGLAITHWRTTKNPARPKFLPPTLYSLFDCQAHIGWDQVLLGRFSSRWVHGSSLPNLTTRGLTYIIKTIWNQIYDVWIQRCNRAHGDNNNSKRKMALLPLTPQVHKLYQERQTVPISEQYIFKKTVEDTLELPTAALENWIFKANIRIKQAKCRLKTQHRLNRPVHLFFTKQVTSPHSKKIRKTKINPKLVKKNNIQKIATTITKYFQKAPFRKINSPKDDLFPP